MLGKGKTTLSSDLDIFGDAASTDEGAATNELDIFWDSGTDEGATDTSTEPQTDTSTDTLGTEDSSATDETLPESGEAPSASDTDTSGDTEQTLEEDPELKTLFDEIDKEIKGDTKLTGLIEELKVNNADLLSQIAVKDRQLETLNEKLVNNAGSEADLGIYRPIIANLEDNPKLMLLAKYMGKQWDNEKVTGRMVSVLSDFIQELTGQDVSELINTNQTSKIMALGSSEKSSVPDMGPVKSQDADWTEEDSKNRLF